MTTEAKIAILEAKVRALQVLVLWHILAADIDRPGIMNSTIRFCEADSNDAPDPRPELSIAMLNDLLDALRLTEPHD